MGLLDERFGLGNFEDDDYCRRAAAAGFGLVITRDAYVHHFGHRSFAAASVDLASLLEHNRRLYDEKWGGAVALALVAGPAVADSSLASDLAAVGTAATTRGMRETFGQATGRVGRPCQNWW